MTDATTSVVRDLVDEFFRAPRVPATTHEEWLLRLCAHLMHREAAVVSLLEKQMYQQQQQGSGALKRGRWNRGRGRSNGSAPSTEPSTETPGA